MSDDEAARLERAHYALQRHLYFTGVQELSGGARAYFADGISEPHWNHAAGVGVGDPAELARLLDQVDLAFSARDLAPAVEVGPTGRPRDLARRLEGRGYSHVYRYAWLTAPTADVGAAAPEPAPGIEVRAVATDADADAFCEVFRAVYPDLEPGYARVLAPAGTPAADCEVVHHLLHRDGVPAACATSLHGLTGAARGMTGIYNLAVHPDQRRQGLGAFLTRHRVAEARRRGQHTVFLQTEHRSVEDWQRRHLFRLAFTTDGYALLGHRHPSPPSRSEEPP